MMTNSIWELLDKKDLPDGVKDITTTWACKMKTSGMYCGRLSARGFEQITGKHFDPTSTVALVTNCTAIGIVL